MREESREHGTNEWQRIQSMLAQKCLDHPFQVLATKYNWWVLVQNAVQQRLLTLGGQKAQFVPVWENFRSDKKRSFTLKCFILNITCQKSLKLWIQPKDRRNKPEIKIEPDQNHKSWQGNQNQAIYLTVYDHDVWHSHYADRQSPGEVVLSFMILISGRCYEKYLYSVQWVRENSELEISEFFQKCLIRSLLIRSLSFRACGKFGVDFIL